MLSIIRRSKVLAVVFALGTLIGGASSVNAACAARKVWIENIIDGSVHLHIMYLQEESTSNGGTVCYYA